MHIQLLYRTNRARKVYYVYMIVHLHSMIYQVERSESTGQLIASNTHLQSYINLIALRPFSMQSLCPRRRTDLVKNQSRGHAKKVKCSSSTFKRVRAHKAHRNRLS